MKKLLLIAALVLSGCANNNPPPTPTPTPQPSPAQPVSTITLALIQTGATVATGAVLNYAESNASSRTTLANQIYASANALYQLTGPNASIVTPAQLNTVLSSYSVGGVSQYTQYVSALQGLYSTYYAKYVTNGSVSAQNASNILNALAAGAEAGAQSYVITPPPVVTASRATTGSNLATLEGRDDRKREYCLFLSDYRLVHSLS